MFDGGGRPGFGFFDAFAWIGHLALGLIGAIVWLCAAAVVVGLIFLLVRYLLVSTKAAQRYLDLNPAAPVATPDPEPAPAPATPVVVVEETVIDEVIVVAEPADAAPVVPDPVVAEPAAPPAPKSATAHASAGSAVPASPKPATKPRAPRTPRAPKTPPTA